jgi:hypothetical protein
MPQGVGYPSLEEDMLAQSAPPQQGVPGPVQAATTPGVPQAADNLRDQLAPMISNEMEDFVVELMAVADDLGVLDDAFGEESIEDQADLQDAAADPMQFLNEQQLIQLVTKFQAIPEPDRSRMEQVLRTELPPQISQRLDAVLRFVQQRTRGQD